MAIELDGPIHEINKEYDEFRDSELRNLGINILRIKNDELKDINEVLIKIEKILQLIHN